MKTAKNLSDFWRYDRSDDQVLELVSILQGADTLIGNMGSDIRVTWSGSNVSYTNLEQHIVALDYGPLRGQGCPFPGAAVDEVIGYAAHEGGHCLWSLPARNQLIRQGIQAQWSYLPATFHKDWQADEPAALAELCRIQNLLEDAYIDCQVASKWPVLGEYIRIARSRLAERTPLDLRAIARADCPDRNALITLWMGVSLYGHPLPSGMNMLVKRALDSLLELTHQAKEERNGLVRQTMAVPVAIILWRDFPIRDAPLPTLPQGQGEPLGGYGTGGSQSQQACQAEYEASQRDSPPAGRGGNLDDFDPATGSGPGGRQVTPLPSELLEKLARALAGEVEDLSRPVALALAEDPRYVAARAKKADYDPELARMVTSQVQREATEIQQAFRHQYDLNARWLYGLDRGKLDGRRLWKPFVGEPGYFKRKEGVGKLSLAVGLLLDVSRSMGRYTSIVKQTAAVFSQGLMHVPGINFAAWCYTGRFGQVALTRICDRELPQLCLANVEQGRGTPSGPAIAGVKVLMERMPEKRHLLIHFTDGKPDSSAQVLKAVQVCRETGIQVCAIGLPQFQGMLRSQYGEGNYETIQVVSELPQSVARIMKRLGASQL